MVGKTRNAQSGCRASEGRSANVGTEVKCHFTGEKTTSKVMVLTGRSETRKSGRRRASLAADYACSPLMSSFLVSRERGNVAREGERERWEGNAKSKRSLSAGGRVVEAD
jgi:hypothetical protein